MIPRKISKILKNGHLSPQCFVKEFNPVIRGWSNYRAIPNVSYLDKGKGKIKLVSIRTTKTILHKKESTMVQAV